jgi:hypothetical protein
MRIVVSNLRYLWQRSRMNQRCNGPSNLGHHQVWLTLDDYRSGVHWSYLKWWNAYKLFLTFKMGLHIIDHFVRNTFLYGETLYTVPSQRDTFLLQEGWQLYLINIYLLSSNQTVFFEAKILPLRYKPLKITFQLPQMSNFHICWKTII